MDWVSVVKLLQIYTHTIRLRRYRQHLVPLTDMDGSDDSDDDQVDDEEPVFMVRALHVCDGKLLYTKGKMDCTSDFLIKCSIYCSFQEMYG